MRPRSMARYLFQAAGHCASARSQPSRSSVQRLMIFMAPWSVIERLGASLTRTSSHSRFANHFNHSVDQRRELLLGDCESRSEINGRPERPDEHPELYEARTQFFEIGDMIQLNDADCSFDPHLLHAGSAPANQEPITQTGCDLRNLLQPGLTLEQIKGGVGRGAGKRIRHEGRPMHERVQRVIRPEGVEDFSSRNRSRKRKRSAGERFPRRQDIGYDGGSRTSKQRSGAAEPGEDFIEYQKQLVAIRSLPQPAQHRWI